MKVCAHFNVLPFQHFHKRFDTIDKAQDYFEDCLKELDPQPNVYDQLPTMDVSAQCKNCDDMMNFHEFAMWRFTVGPRKGIVKVRSY
jgi:hypothetical protein